MPPMAELRSSLEKPIGPRTLMQLAPFAVFVGWLAVACYALVFLISH